MAMNGFKKKSSDDAEERDKLHEQKRQSHYPAPRPFHDDSNWLLSYADMMTLLCGFFIMLFSMAKLDVPQYNKFKKSIATQFGGVYVSGKPEENQFATQIIHELGEGTSAIVETDAAGVTVTFESATFFETLSAEMSEKGLKIISRLGSVVREREKNLGKKFNIAVEGHTDSRPITSGVYASNWELSAARSTRVVRLLLEQGFSASHLTALSYADSRPKVEARTPSGDWDEASLGKNRRVVVRILEPTAEGVPFPELLTANQKSN
jgi:chemotaxis protein MotB